MDENIIKRTMPNSPEAEQSVIGAMILDNGSISSVEDILTAEDFYQRQYGIMYDAIVELNRTGRPADLLTLKNLLQEKDVAPEISSMTYIGELIANVPITGNAKYYAEIVKEKSTLRKLIRTCEDVANDCYAGKEKVEKIMADTEENVFRVLNQRRVAPYAPIDQIVADVIDRVQNPTHGVFTGFTDLDDKTTGLQPSDLVLIAARPSMGKTAFALNIAQYVAFKKNGCVVIFSLEMSKEQLVTRLLSMESKVDSQKLRTGQLTDDDWYRVGESASTIARSGMIIDDTPGISVAEMRTKCRKFKLDNDIKLIIIDYLQLMSGAGRSDNRTQEVAEISRALKGLARELGVPVIALSQLSRAPEQRPDHRPMMSDLRESGAIEQDADIVMFLYREDYYKKDTDEKNVTEVILAKQRNGPIGTVKLAWLPDFTKFANLSKEQK
ncbi:MAG: replicative DNA helicase [Lachnospiraceae bacterium]|nr:replicative DNA helicase [Lachnospiraceae bacterium]